MALKWRSRETQLSKEVLCEVTWKRNATVSDLVFGLVHNFTLCSLQIQVKHLSYELK